MAAAAFMARRLTSKTYEERPLEDGARLPPPAPPPGPDPQLGKEAVRYIAERWVGELTQLDRTGEFVIKGKGKQKLSLQQLMRSLSSHEGFKVEITIYEDADPDVVFRMAEAIQGIEGDSFTWSGPSVYVARLVYEFQRAFPDREYDVSLGGETITVDRLVKGERDRRFRLESPVLGTWALKAWRPDGDTIGFKFDSFVEALTTMKAIEFHTGSR
jgi:hypothetical protein